MDYRIVHGLTPPACPLSVIAIHVALEARGGATGGAGGNRPPKDFKKGKILKYGVFSCIKISFSDIFNKEIHALRGLLSRF